MKQLETEIRKNGFTYKFENRGEKAMIYSQWNVDKLVGYEVFKIRVNKGGERWGQTFEDSEAFPSDESFGKWAWTYKTTTEARKRFLELHTEAKT